MKRVLITSAIPSVNGVKHLGNLVGSLLPADVYARFCRARGFETLAICATDEHGSTTELAAPEAGMDVRDLLRRAIRCRRKRARASACPGTISAARPTSRTTS
jgi:methionyl-tRNA synthetase